MEAIKSRLLFLLDLLNCETDEENPITVAEIMTRMEAEGFSATRKTIAGDIDTLLAHGVDVVCNKSRQNKYFIGDRDFELPELTMLVDAVQAAKFISVKQSKTLIKKLDASEGGDLFNQLRALFYGDKTGGLHGVHHEFQFGKFKLAVADEISHCACLLFYHVDSEVRQTLNI